jgi:hypothetical protein
MEEYQVPHNEAIDKGVLVDNLRGLSERELGGVVAAVGRAPESRSRAYFLALS